MRTGEPHPPALHALATSRGPRLGLTLPTGVLRPRNNGSVASRTAFEVDAIPGERWELALELLRDAGPLFLLPGPVTVALQRHDGWPEADGRIHVSLGTTREPQQVTPETAQREVDLGLDVLRRAEAADPRLSEMFDTYGFVIEYVYDYGHGAVRIGSVSADGRVHLD